jgi:hypothetical protein
MKRHASTNRNKEWVKKAGQWLDGSILPSTVDIVVVCIPG